MVARIKKVTVAIPTWGGLAHLRHCLPALAGQRAGRLERETLVFDNSADPRLATWLGREHPRVRLLSSRRNIGFAAACNRLAEAASGDAVAFLNDDTRPCDLWLAALTEAYAAAPEDVAAVSGLLLDWTGDRLDFGEGIVTFDGHALQRGHRTAICTAPVPHAGAELPFACGGNMLVHRDRFLDSGGFDETFFAYFEDVDLGWRLWQEGFRVIAAPEARACHRMAGSSDRLGIYERGYLFEANAYRVAYKNYEDGLWETVAPLVLLVLISRSTHALQASRPGGGQLRARPLERHQDGASQGTASCPVAEPEPRWQRRSTAATLMRAAQRVGATISSKVAGLYPWPALWVTDERAIGQLRLLDLVVSGDDLLRRSRRRVQARRKRPDSEIFARFPRYVVPTYPGDQVVLSAENVARWLPENFPVRHATLAELRNGVT